MFLKKSQDQKCDVPTVPIAKVKEIRRDRPVMIYDGDCGFCQRWILKWQKITRDKIQYAPYQFFVTNKDGKIKEFPNISINDCKKAIQFVLLGGAHCEAAEAVFQAFHFSGRQKVWLWLYKYFPGFKFLSEGVYKFISSNRFWF